MKDKHSVSTNVMIGGIAATLLLVLVLAAAGIHCSKRSAHKRLEALSDTQLQQYIEDNTLRHSQRSAVAAALKEQARRQARSQETALQNARGVAHAEEKTELSKLASHAGRTLGIVVVVLLVAIVYFLPSYIAHRRGHHNHLSIFLANCFFGLTGIAWLALIVWACSDLQQHRAIVGIHTALKDPQ